MSIYHQLFDGLLHDLFFKRLLTFYDLPTALVTLLVAVVVARLNYRVFDRSFIALEYRYGYEDETKKWSAFVWPQSSRSIRP